MKKTVSKNVQPKLSKEIRLLQKQNQSLMEDISILKEFIQLSGIKKVEAARELMLKKTLTKKKICELLGISRSTLYEKKSQGRTKYYKKNDQEVVEVIKEVGKLGAYCLNKLVMEVNELRKKRGQKGWSEKKIKRILTLYAKYLGDIVPPSLVFMMDSSKVSKM